MSSAKRPYLSLRPDTPATLLPSLASDTRKGVAELQRMEERRTRAGTPQSVTPTDEP